MFCGYCGKENSEDYNFCAKCGKPMENEAPSQETRAESRHENTSTAPQEKRGEEGKKRNKLLIVLFFLVGILFFLTIDNVNDYNIVTNLPTNSDGDDNSSSLSPLIENVQTGFRVVLAKDVDKSILLTIENDSKKYGMTPSIINEGGQWLLFLGPYPTQEEAIKMVAYIRKFDIKRIKHVSTSPITPSNSAIKNSSKANSSLFSFSGSVYGEEPVDTQYWDNGKLKWETYYDEEQKKGLGVGWYKSGEKEVEVHYIVSKEDEQVSLIEDGKLSLWYKNGNRRSEELYKEGKLEGLLTTWYESAMKWSESNYKNGKRDGLTTAWFESGNKKEEFHYKNGELDGEQTQWHESGRKQSTRYYKFGIESGVRTEWDKVGMKTFQGNFVDGVEETN